MTPAERELKALAEKATPGPWFNSPDDAADAPVHAKSGLGMVDTGRSGDWPIARLCEWPEADYIAACSPERILALLARVEKLEAALRNIVICRERWSPNELNVFIKGALADSGAEGK